MQRGGEAAVRQAPVATGGSRALGRAAGSGGSETPPGRA